MNDLDTTELFSEACAAEREGDVSRAITLLQAVVHRETGHALAWTLLGELYSDQEQYAAAELAFDNAIRSDPAVAAAYSGLGRVMSAMGQHARAEDAFERSIALQPTTNRYVLLADVRTRLGKDADAVKDLRHALSLDGDNEEAMLSLALLIRESDSQQALALLRRAASIDPLDPTVARELGFELARANRLGEAEHWLDTALHLDPSDAWTNLYLGTLYVQQARMTEAAAAHESAVRCAPLSPVFHQRIAVFYDQNGDTRKALESLRVAAALDPTDAEGAFLLGQYLVDIGSRQEGAEWIERALALDPQHARALTLQRALIGGEPVDRSENA